MKKGKGNLTLTGKGKIGSGKQRVTYLMKLGKWMAEERMVKIAKR